MTRTGGHGAAKQISESKGKGTYVEACEGGINQSGKKAKG